MAHDPDAFASMVTLAIKAAQAPLFERIAVLEARLAALPNSEPALLELRDRVTVVETKAVHLPPSEAPQPVDLTPLLERLAATEARLDTLGDLRDRVTVVETKSLQVPPQVELVPPVDLTPVLERLAAAEAKLETLGDVRDRVTVVETKSAMPQPEAKPVDFGPVLDRVTALELKSAETAPLLASLSELTKDVAGMRERLAVAEVKTGVPGPPGKDGKDGKDGTDGFGFDDLTIEQLDERTAVYKGTKDDRVREFGRFKSHAMIQRGVWLEGKSYERGDVVTWGGSQWHANEDTATKPGEDAKAWTLVVKRGRDGRDGKDAAAPPPVVKVHAS
jgi:hypothetical protein